MVEINFPNSTTIEAEVNGNCLIVDEKPDFPADLSVVTVNGTSYTGGEEINWTFHNAKIIEPYAIDGRYWFAFLETPKEELDKKMLESKIEYVAMMADVEI